MGILLAAALLLLHPPAGAAVQETPLPTRTPAAGEKEYSDLALSAWKQKQELQQRLDDIKSRLGGLPALKEEYARAQDLETLFRLRSGTARPVLDEMESVWTAFNAFHETKKRLDHMGVLMSVAALSRGKAPSADSGYALSSAMDRSKREIDRSIEEIKALLADEHDAFHAARERIIRRRRLRLSVFGLGAVCVLGAVAGLMLRRRARALPGPGTVLGGVFRLERELGRGSVGVVYEAEDLSLRRKVALKRMDDEVGRDPAGSEAFLREAQSVALLKHPNIVTIYSVLREGESMCLVLEFVEGTSLARLIQGGRRLPLREAQSVVRQAALALEHAHGAGILHRDLKPSNILVRPDGAVKVTDFGLVRGAKDTLSRRTGLLAGGGREYLAPEQELGRASKASDVFSLGVCAYEMLTGTFPFPGPDFLAKKKEMSFTAPSRASRGTGVPPEADEVLRRALQAEPGRRFSSAAGFAEAFGALPEA